MTITKLYKSLNEGTISKGNFMFQLRRDPIASQWINGHTQFDSAIRILKAKSIISEIKAPVESKPIAVRGIQTIETVLAEVRQMYPQGPTLHDVVKYAACTKLTEGELEDLQIQFIGEEFGAGDPEEEAIAKATQINRPVPELQAYITKVKEAFSRKYDLNPQLIQHLITTYPKLIEMGFKSRDSAEYTAENIMTMDEIEVPELNEFRQLQEVRTSEQIAQIDKTIPGEFRIGLNTEMAKGKDADAATKIVLKNLEKDPIFYTNAIAGLKPNRKRTDIMVPVDAKVTNVLDKANAFITAVKTEKGDSAKETKEEVKPVAGVKQETMNAQGGKGIKKDPTPGKEKTIKLSEGLNKLIQKILKEELTNG